MKKTSKIISTLSALSMLASLCVMPAAHAEYTYDRSGANFVAGTDFENRWNVGSFETADAGNFLSDMWGKTNAEFSSAQKHSGAYSLHSKAEITANAGISTDKDAWAYWNENVSTHALEKGKTYKYSYWVYADESATLFTPNTLVSNGSGGYDWKIESKNYSGLSKETWNYFETIFTAKATSLPFFYNIPANLYIDDIKLEEVFAPQMTATTLPADGKTTSVGRNRYTITFDKDIASATVKVGTSTVTNTISEDKKTVSFEVMFQSAGEKTVTVDVTDTDGASAQVTRTFTVRDTWVAFTDFENHTSAAGQAYAHMQNTPNMEMSQTVTHSGKWSLHCTSNCGSDVHTYLQNANWSWAYWNGNTDKTTPDSNGNYNYLLTVGKTYKYSYWVYADEGAMVTTPNVLVKKSNGGYDPWLIAQGDYASLPKQQWNYFEGVFKAESTELPFFWNMNANLYIDDILIEEIPTANVISTTLPEDGTNAALGYNEYTMTFDKEVVSAKVTYNGKTTDATVSEDGKTISFGLAAVKDGDVSIAITDSDALTSKVTRAITVPDTLVLYTGFDNGQTAGYYVSNNGWSTPLETTEYRSPGAALRLVTTEQYGASIEVTSNRLDGTDYSKIDEGTAVFTKGQWYKVSFYGKTGEVGTNPQIGVARRDENGIGYGVEMFTMTDEMTKYEVTFKALSNKKPFLYREEIKNEIIIDDLLIEQVEAPVDYIYNLSASTVKANASITATLSNEKLDAMNGVAVIALYKDGILQDCKMTNVTNLAKGAEVSTDAVTVPADISDGVYTVKAFLWDDFGATLSPKCVAKEIVEPAE